jgi:alpha-L-fucosidase 2
MTLNFPMACVVAALLSLAPMASADLKKDIEYARAGDTRLKLDASVPDGAGQFPVVIVVHGGGWASGDKATDLAPLLTPLTDAHYTWFSINYRLAPASRWPAGYDDVRTAIRWVKTHAADFKGDPNHIALLGYSAGGHLACLAATENDPTTTMQAIVGIAPPTDLEIDLPQRGGLSKSLQDLLDRPKELSVESRKQLHEMSAVNHIRAGMPPFLLMHGTADKSVPYDGSVTFAARLKAVKVPCELITINDAPHRLSDWEKFDPKFGLKMVSWLDKTLKPASTQP